MTAPISMLAIDLAKGSFQVCAIGADGACVIYALSTPGGMVDVEPCLGDIDADVDLVHDISCSCSVGSAPTAPNNCSG